MRRIRRFLPNHCRLEMYRIYVPVQHCTLIRYNRISSKEYNVIPVALRRQSWRWDSHRVQECPSEEGRAGRVQTGELQPRIQQQINQVKHKIIAKALTGTTCLVRLFSMYLFCSALITSDSPNEGPVNEETRFPPNSSPSRPELNVKQLPYSGWLCRAKLLRKIYHISVKYF